MRKKNTKQLFEKLTVIDAGAKGKSVAKHRMEGYFLKQCHSGCVVDIQTTKKRSAYYEGTAVVFHSYSDKRTQAVCEHFGVCGGCKWQHMAYEHQLYYKQKEVENNLKRLGKIELPEITPISGSEEHYFYRNKMEFSFSDSRWLTLDEIQSTEEIGRQKRIRFPYTWCVG